MEATQVVELGRDATVARRASRCAVARHCAYRRCPHWRHSSSDFRQRDDPELHTQARGARSRASARRELAAGAPGGLHAGLFEQLPSYFG